MAKYKKAKCDECGERDFCRMIDGDQVCVECLDSFGGDGGYSDAESIRDFFTRLSDECPTLHPSDADPGL